jgi:hypothetical protein
MSLFRPKVEMNNLTRKSVILLAAFFFPDLLAVDLARSQDDADPDHLSVDVMQVLELPAHVTSPTLLRSDKGYLLKCQISNNSNDPILGFTYQLLVLDSANKFRVMVSRTAALKLTGYATKDLTLRQPAKLKIKSGDRVVLAIEQVITRELVWAVLNSREALVAYGRGDYLAPEVKQVLNQVDTKPGSRVIY